MYFPASLKSVMSTPRSAVMVVFGAFGVAVGALAGSMPSLTRTAGVDAEMFGLGLTIATLATVTALSLGGVMARFTSNRRALLWALPMFAMLMMAYMSSQTPSWFFVSFVSMGFLFGFTDIFMNTEGAAIEHDLGRPVFTTFHACVSVGVAFMAIASSFVSALLGPWATGLICAAFFAIAWVMVFRNIVPRQLAVGRSGEGGRISDKRPLVLLGIAAGIVIAGETAALMWSAKLLDEQAPALAAIVGLGAAFFGLCNAVLRFPGDALRARLGDLPLMLASLGVAIIGFAALGYSTRFAVSVVAFAAVGLGTAVVIPCILAMAAALVPGNRAGGLGFVSMLSGAPRILAPWGIGWIAGSFGMNMAFGLLAAGLCVALLLVAGVRQLGYGTAGPAARRRSADGAATSA